MLHVSKENLELQRKNWSEVAKENGWYVEPFFVQLWVDGDGYITDSVSFKGMKSDYVVDLEDNLLTEGEDYELI